MTNQEVIMLMNATGNLISKDIKMPPKVSYALLKNRKKLEEIVIPYEQERERIMGELKIEELPEDKRIELEELLCIDNDIDIHFISESDLERCDNLSVVDVVALDFMIKE